MKRPHLISYLAPSIPYEFFGLVADDLGASLEFNEAISGPLPGDDDPFTSGRADIGFVCSPTYRWLRPRVELLPLPVPADPRCEGRPVYFAEVVVRADRGIRGLQDLRGAVWAYNDRNSRSGWLSMVERVGDSFFSRHVHAGSHLRSIEMVRSGAADAAAIDSNVLVRSPAGGLAVIETWGPFAIQATIVRADADPALKSRVAEALLTLHKRSSLAPFGFVRFTEPDDSMYDGGH